MKTNFYVSEVVHLFYAASNIVANNASNLKNYTILYYKSILFLLVLIVDCTTELVTDTTKYEFVT